jgi:hypothetical protein
MLQRRQRLGHGVWPDLAKNRLQQLDAGRKRIPIGVYGIGTTKARQVSRIVTALRRRDGGGFIVRRPFPSEALRNADPFLLFDEMGPIE